MIYAIHKTTKEHRIAATGQSWDGDAWDLHGADANGWIPWQGGECPLPNDQPCEAKTRSGEQAKFNAAGHVIGWKKAIIAYRPILETKPEAPGWNGDCPPPVGCECEGHITDTAGQWRWAAVEVLMQKENECAVHVPSMGLLRWCDEFRPIRSEEDRAVDDMAKVMKSVVPRSGDKRPIEDVALALYRAGYRKQGE